MWGMTDTLASPPASESPNLSSRLDASDPPWPLRPWIMAAIAAVAGLVFYLLVDRNHDAAYEPWRDALAALVAISTVVFVLGAEQRRWHWAAGFALAWGAVIGLIVWHSAGYNVGGSPVEWPFWSGILAVLVATPLFQTRRDVAPDWRFWKLWQMPYDRLHDHAWTDAVIGAAALAFVGVAFLLTVLIGEMFHLIGIELIRDLLRDEWFGWMLAGAAFGGAVGLLRERDRLVATLQKLVMIVLAVLAPVLAAALILFLLSLLGTGLGGLWRSGFSAAALMLGVAAFAVVLANAVIGKAASERSGSGLLHGAAAVLAVAVLPLAAIAGIAMQLRIAQYGWTPERIWGGLAVGVALAYGLAGLWAVAKARRGFDTALRPLQQRLAIGLMLLAAFLALPIVDFGAIATRDQLARFEDGRVTRETFDWAAMAFDFGPAGRRALERLAKSPQRERAEAAKAALAAKNRYDLVGPRGLALVAPLAERLRVVPAGRVLPAEAMAAIGDIYMCKRATACAAVWLDDDRIGVLAQYEADPDIAFEMLSRDERGQWVQGERTRGTEPDKAIDLMKARIEVQTVARRQINVDGKRVGADFE